MLTNFPPEVICWIPFFPSSVCQLCILLGIRGASFRQIICIFPFISFVSNTFSKTITPYGIIKSTWRKRSAQVIVIYSKSAALIKSATSLSLSSSLAGCTNQLARLIGREVTKIAALTVPSDFLISSYLSIPSVPCNLVL